METQELKEEVITINASDSIDEFAIFKKEDEKNLLAEDLRIEETVNSSWSGVSGCGSAKEIERQVKAAYEGWVQKKLFEYRNLKYKTFGHGEGKVKTHSSHAPWPDNSRKCGGSLSLPCYIVFERP
jgi:hypothetical protein